MLNSCFKTAANNHRQQQRFSADYSAATPSTPLRYRRVAAQRGHVSGAARVKANTPAALFRLLRSLMSEQFTITRRSLRVTVRADQPGRPQKFNYAATPDTLGISINLFITAIPCVNKSFSSPPSVCRQSRFLWWH